MPRLQTILMTLAATALTASAAPRVALVRVRDIYANLESTKALDQEIKAEREQIMKDPRAEILRKAITELQALQARYSDKTNPLDEAESRKLAPVFEIKRQEAQTLQKEFEQFRTEQEKQINRKMVAAMRASLNQIMEASRTIAKNQGCDLVFDSSGNTNTGVPFVLYHKESLDLTDDVNSALTNKTPSAAADTAAKNPETPITQPTTPTKR